MTTRRHDAEATRQAILEAATTLFAELGVGRVSVSKIATAAGVTKSLIHHHFGSKRELWLAVRQHTMSEYLEAQADLLRNRPADAELFVDSIDTYFRFLQRRPTLVRLMAWMAVDPESQVEKDGDAVLALGVERIDEGKAQGLVASDIDSQSAIISFLGTIERYFVNRSMFPHCGASGVEEMDELFLDSIKKIYLRGMAPPVQ